MSLWLRNCRLIDGTGAPPKDKMAVEIVGDKFGKIVADDQAVLAPGDTVTDMGGDTVLPGLWDNHMHLGLFMTKRDDFAFLPDHTLKCARRAVEYLGSGITTLRTLADRSGIDIALRDAIARGAFPGPRLFVPGQATTTTGGHGYASGAVECNGPYEVRKNVREQLKRGVDFIKIMMTGGILGAHEGHVNQQMTEDECYAACEVAHWAGKHVAAHIGGAEGAKMAVKCGVDSLEHCYALDEEVVEMMAKAGTMCCPTLVVTDTPWLYAELGADAWALKKLEMAKEKHVKGFKMVLEAGVKFSVGSDLPASRIRGVIACVREMQLMVELGAKPLDVISAATLRPAELLGVADKLGTVETGKFADVTAVKGDPLPNMKALENPVLIIKAGKKVPVTKGGEHPDLGNW